MNVWMEEIRKQTSIERTKEGRKEIDEEGWKEIRK
jgi:hypothetical protein